MRRRVSSSFSAVWAAGILVAMGCEADAVVSSQADIAAGTDVSSADGADGTDGVDANDTPDVTEEPAPVLAERAEEAAGPVSFMVVVDQLLFPRVSDDQKQAVGFDLDQFTSDDTDIASCSKPDLVSPVDGQVGIDNQLATIIPVMDLVGLGAFQTLVQRAIEEGGLLIFFELADVDDLQNDESVSLTLRGGEGTPLLGTDGRLLSGQTFHEKADSEQLTVQAKIENGIVTAEGFDTVVPVVVFGVPYAISMKDAKFRARLTDDGGMTDGLLGGSVPISDIIGIAERANMNDASILPAVELLTANLADMDRDENGECQSLSAAIQITGVSAFLFEDHF